MTKSQKWQRIPTRLSFEHFQQFVLPHLSTGSRGPAPKLPLHRVFNYILQTLHLGCQWKELPIEKDHEGRPEIHYTRIYSAFRRWQADGCFDAVFAGSVATLHQANLLDATVIHGDGTTTAAKKGGDNIGFSGHKKVKGDKIVAFCDRNCNVIAPFVSAPGNRNESPLLREALPLVTRIAHAVGIDLHGTIVSLDGVYDCRTNRKAIFNRRMIPNINANLEGYVRSAAQCCGLRECGPHISRIERRRGSLAAMGKGRDGAVWRRGRRAALHENRCRDWAKQPWEVWSGSWARRHCGDKARQRRRWRRGAAPRELEGRRRQEERHG